MKRTVAYSTIFIAVCLLSFVSIGAVLAQTSIITFFVSNTLGIAQTSVQVPANLSSVTLAEGGYMNANGLNTNVTGGLTGSSSIGYMPGSDRIRVLACFDDFAADDTTDCNDDDANDITLPAGASEVFEFAADNQFRTLWLSISTPAIAVWDIEWQYYDGTSYVAFDDVADGTNDFSSPGLRRVTWGFPLPNQWPEATLHSIEGYWVRAEVSSFTSISQAPFGNQAWYETGRLWALADTLALTNQQEFDFELGLPSDTKDFHYYFPHQDGIIVEDDATIGVTASWVKIWKGYFDMTAPLTGSGKKIAFKEGSLEITIPADGIIQVEAYR